MKLSYRLFAEFIGTLALVLIGCGSAVLAGDKVGYLGISLAFGLTVTVFAYAVGGVSGGHFNPAVTLSQVLIKSVSISDGLFYVLAQIAGAICGSGILIAISNQSQKLGQNQSGTLYTQATSFFAELVFTFLFVYVILGVTTSYSHHKFAPIAIGLMLTLAHICLIPVTGTSLNPARSIAPAIFVQGQAITELWVFIVAPLLGSALATLAHIFFTPEGETDI